MSSFPSCPLAHPPSLSSQQSREDNCIYFLAPSLARSNTVQTLGQVLLAVSTENKLYPVPPLVRSTVFYHKMLVVLLPQGQSMSCHPLD